MLTIDVKHSDKKIVKNQQKQITELLRRFYLSKKSIYSEYNGHSDKGNWIMIGWTRFYVITMCRLLRGKKKVFQNNFFDEEPKPYFAGRLKKEIRKPNKRHIDETSFNFNTYSYPVHRAWSKAIILGNDIYDPLVLRSMHSG